LPAGLIFENDSVVVVPNHTVNVTFSDPNDGTQPVTIIFDFGTFTNGEIINITFNATIADIPENYHRRIIGPNLAELTWNDNDGNPHNDSDVSGNVSVIRLPRLNLTDSVRKTAEPANILPGGFVDYTVSITNLGFAPAFNITVADVLPQYVTYIGNSTFVNGLPGPNPDNISAGPNGTTVITWTNLILQINASETVVVRYAGYLAPEAPYGKDLINTVTVTSYEDEEGTVYPGASAESSFEVLTPVPVLSGPGLLILAGLLAVIATSQLRRKRKQR
ncbi:MAG: DUF11 domain-containing protein, partial [Methanomicrobia archaeon]|nr:DUF11 domain-containing protein [Methanomicrobia archaeon]